MAKGPILIELDEEPPSPDAAPPVPDLAEPTRASAMEQAVAYVARPPNRLARWFWGTLGALIAFVAGLMAWDFVMGLIARSPILGTFATVLVGVFCLILLAVALRELAAFARLRRLDRIQENARAALAEDDANKARGVLTALKSLYSGRAEMSWGLDRLEDRAPENFDADALLSLAETDVLAPLDAAATQEIESAARQVATVTAIVPLALADIFTALTANLRMIRRIAEIYGGRAGTLGSWRLTKSVFTHLVATGAVSVGDDLIGSVAGGGVLSKLSRRFGEGIINGALTARVGVAALEVCRPVPFTVVERPSVTQMVRRALTGLFSRGDRAEA